MLYMLLLSTYFFSEEEILCSCILDVITMVMKMSEDLWSPIDLKKNMEPIHG